MGKIMSNHIEKQVTPMKLSFWVKLEYLATSGNTYAKTIALTWLLIITGVIRFAHVQTAGGSMQ